MERFSRILIIRTDRIGDVVLTTPSIRAIRKKYPNAKITLLVAPQTISLINDNPHFDDVIFDDRQGINRNFFGFLRLVSLVRSKKFDLAINFHTKKRTNLLCFLAGIPKRLGYKDKNYGFLLNLQGKDERHLGKMHEAQYCLSLLKALGINSEDLGLDISIQKDSEEWFKNLLRVKGFLKDKKLIGIHPGGSDPTRRWPQENFIRVINEVKAKYDCHFIFIGDKEIEETSNKMLKVSSSDILNLIGKTTVSQLVSIIKSCDILISNDSGPVHIAAALNVPVVAIFTRNQPGINKERWRPLNDNSISISVPLEDKLDFSKAGKIDPRSLQNIPISHVLEAVDSLIKLC
ncbi:MAG: glycosyltransferase family 9 protein [Candidatus Omnitrophica bacterium]|nr:glycosyltransferase family 9 protein [Candidatus Omnitrophota bacterium]